MASHNSLHDTMMQFVGVGKTVGDDCLHTAIRFQGFTDGAVNVKYGYWNRLDSL